MKPLIKIQDIVEIFQKKSKSEQVSILWKALGIMESYNGRTKITCVAMAMGYQTEDEIFFTKNKN